MGPEIAATLLPGLIESLLEIGVRVRVAVGGRSMSPRLRQGDLVIIEPLAGGPPGRGDLVLYRRSQGALVLHRVLRRWRDSRGRWQIQTRGDADPRLDASVPAARVLGRVRHIERDGRKPVDVATPARRLRARALGAALLAGSALHYAGRRLHRARIPFQAITFFKSLFSRGSDPLDSCRNQVDLTPLKKVI